MTRLAPALVLAGVVVVGAAGAASATGHHDKPGKGHTPIVVCHNVTHNPHIIVVDDDSTKLHAHLAHRTQAQLMDLVEGVDGSAAQIRAACVRPTTIPTTTPTEVPSSTTTTASTTPSSTSTTTQTSQPTSPSPTSSTPKPPETAMPSSPSTTLPAAESSPPTTGSKPPWSPSQPSPRRSVPSSTVAPPEELARTGFDWVPVFAAALLLLVGGWFIRLSHKGAHR